MIWLAGGALNPRQAVNHAGPHRNCKGGLPSEEAEILSMKNAKHDLIKETHRRKMETCQLALKQNRTRNIATIWQKTLTRKTEKLPRS